MERRDGMECDGMMREKRQWRNEGGVDDGNKTKKDEFGR